MTKEKVRLYKNPNRAKVDAPQPYVPQYQLYGYEPEEMKSAMVPPSIQKMKPIMTHENPRVRQPSIRQEYTTATVSPIGRGRGPVPNVGNNMEHTWSGVDGEIIDDLGQEIDPNHPMIDNNDYVTDTALGALNQSIEVDDDGLSQEDTDQFAASFDEPSAPPVRSFLTEQQLQNLESEKDSEDLSKLLQELESDTYVLLVDGAAVVTGPLEFVQEQATLLVFGEHELCDGNPIPVEDLVIIKKLNLKVGLFIQ
jgi:hypothetical protein